jgi:ERCC4-type nuclease
MSRKSKPSSIVCPFTVLIDTREQRPYTFRGIKADAKDGNVPLEVPTERGTIQTGDYSIVGFRDRVTIERKSKEDLYGSVVKRANFEQRLERMALMDFAAVVVEAEWDELINDPPPFTEFHPRSLYRTILAWTQRFRTVHWYMLPSREFAEIFTVRILHRYYLDRTANHNATTD